MEIPEHHKKAVIPHLMVDGAAKAIDFYAEAFGGVELFRLDGDDGRIVHAEVAVHGSTFMLGDADVPSSTPQQAGTSVVLHVYVPDVDALTATAVTSGAELLTAPTDMPYGARQSMLRDPFGHLWIFLTP